MEIFQAYLAAIKNEAHRCRMGEVLTWVQETFPTLKPKMAWNQPMFTYHGTFIIGFSAAKGHLSVAPEAQGLAPFSEDIRASGYSQGRNLFRIPWDVPVNFPLLERIIRFNIEDKSDCATFWRR